MFQSARHRSPMTPRWVRGLISGAFLAVISTTHLGCGLDYEIAIREIVVFFRRLDAAKCGFAIVFGDGLLADLTRHVAVDGGQTGLDAIGRDIIEKN